MIIPRVFDLGRKDHFAHADRISFNIRAYVDRLNDPYDDRFLSNPIIKELVMAWRHGVTRAERPFQCVDIMAWHSDDASVPPRDRQERLCPLRLTFNVPLVDVPDMNRSIEIIPRRITCTKSARRTTFTGRHATIQ